MGKFYAVFKGKSNTPIILNSWDKCKEEVHGVKGAIYKSFKTEDEAREYLNANETGTINENKEDIEIDGTIAYVDGSFSEEKSNYSYGLIVIQNGVVVHEESGVGDDLSAVALRNISGEVLGAIKAVEYAIENSYSDITIVHDYQGIASWAMGTWNRNKELTKNYYEKMTEYKKKININFKKVKGHSGDKYNDAVDKLAKEALGIR